MMWSDGYLGLPFLKGGRDRTGLDCYGLVRLVWQEQAGFAMPRFDEWDRRQEVLAREAKAFAAVSKGQERALDAVLMNADLLIEGSSGSRKWQRRPVHLGVIAAPGFVLHIEEGRLSCVEPLNDLDVAEIYRGPELQQ
jgi:cell wall-associated NlpC family hydrolase